MDECNGIKGEVTIYDGIISEVMNILTQHNYATYTSIDIHVKHYPVIKYFNRTFF